MLSKMDEKLLKISELYFTGDQELATAWLKQLIGDGNAAANIFVMLLISSMDNDQSIELERFTHARMKFKTYPTRFGKDYRYDVTFDFAFKGNGLCTTGDYSRFQVGNGEPKYYLLELICHNLRKDGYVLHNALFIGTRKHFVVETE